jgi:AcrR family transcriptional regulator
MAKINREVIVEAAVRLFNEHGYHATSMQDVAQAVAIKKPSLYHHFTSKEAILLTILEGGMDRLISDLEAIIATNQSGADKLRAAIRAHANRIAANPQAAAVFLREDRGLGDGYMAHYIEKRDHFENLFRRIVQQAVDDGEFRAVDVPIAVQALLGMVNWMTRWYRADGRLSADEIADSFAALFLDGVSAQN